MATNISTITIHAGKEKVWQALTNPQLVKAWQYGSDVITTWQPGSSIRFRAEWQGQIFEQWGTVLDVQEHAAITYTLFAPRPGLEDVPANYFTMHYTLTEGETGHTTLQIVQEDNRPHAVQEAPQGEENPILQALKAVAEGL